MSENGVESADSRKRAREEDEATETSAATNGALSSNVTSEPPTKRIAKYMIKILVANNHAGLVVGKGGAVIKQMQEVSGASIKISQSGQFFPLTDQRTLLIASTESLEKVVQGLGLVVNKLSEVRISCPFRVS
jgi:polyribonucleotide nucleotidyltransferase